MVHGFLVWEWGAWTPQQSSQGWDGAGVACEVRKDPELEWP